VFPKFVQAVEEKRPCRDQRSRDESDLCAQWRAANAAEDAAGWAWWQLVVSVAGVIGLGVTLWFNRIALAVARDANAETRRIGEAQTRAYVSISSVQGQHYADGLVLKAIAKNSGQSPALDAFIEFKIVKPDGGTEVRHVLHLHAIPAQSEHEFGNLYYRSAEAKNWSGLVVFVVVAFDTVFGAGETAAESFVGSPSEWDDKSFTDLTHGRHVKSYLLANPDA
jgi:hypothetical protein